MIGRRRQDWRAVALVVACASAALLAFAVAASLLTYTVIGVAGGSLALGALEPFQTILVASALALIGVVCLPPAYFGVQALRGTAIPVSTPKPMRIWQGLVLFILWIGAAWLAQLLFGTNPWRWFAPPFYLLAIGLPVYFLIRLAAAGLNGGSLRRVWGLLTTGMLLGTSLAVLAESALAILGLLIAAIYLALHPDQLIVLRQLTVQVTGASGMEELFNVLQSWLQNPLTYMLALLVFSGFTPLIEEGAKSIATWAVFDRLQTPSQGFLAGAMAGAGFGLLESLLASASPDSNWAFTLMVRGGSTMMHIVASALAGWGIGSFRASRRAGHLLAGYALALVIHSVWNASVVTLAFGGVQLAVNSGKPNAIGMALLLLGSIILIGLCLSIPIALAVLNRRLRADLAQQSSHDADSDHRHEPSAQAAER